MEQAYPIAYTLFEFDNWKSIVHDFFTKHDAQTPQIWKLPLEFYEFVKENNYATKFKLPFLNDLLFFEWIEIEVHTMEDEIQPLFKIEGDILTDKLVVNPEFRLNKLDYPVHKVKPKDITLETKGDYFLLTYRVKDTGSVAFLDLTMLHTFVFEKLVNEEISLKNIINDAIEVFGIDNSEFINQSVLEFGKLLMDKKIVLGYN